LVGALVYVCSTGSEGDAAAREVMDFWASVIGAHPVRIEAATHDLRLAWSSHLPQPAASALPAAAARNPSLRGNAFGCGIRDTTRIAASPVEMCVEVLLKDREPAQAALAGMNASLDELRGLLDRGNREALTNYLTEAARFR